MKCEQCFFCTYIEKGIYADYPVKYCKYHKKYILPIKRKQVNGGKNILLDLSDIKDLKIWHDIGCSIHPKIVEKAKRDFLKTLEDEKDKK